MKVIQVSKNSVICDNVVVNKGNRPQDICFADNVRNTLLEDILNYDHRNEKGVDVFRIRT